ncbi:MAG: transglycosylase domain-containing protein [Alphaproteobacteria bacterium]|jgi:penicillin-binding protein 1A|nr:PBP1A family penicillin-binding protein [Candidatus Jidaibacter sp.]
MRKKKSKVKRARKKQPNFIRSSRFYKKLLISLISIALFFFVMGFLLLIYYTKDLPDIEEIARKDIRPQIRVFDTNGIELAKYGDLIGKTLTYSQLPTNMIEAVIAAEDHRYFDHNGIDWIGITRAYLVNLKAGRVVQGGSTITQQLAKIIYLSPERTMKRKVQEFLIAIELEKKFSKEQIMSLYLNRVYLGKGTYGVDAASQYYFGKPAEDLTPFESAMLAGMLKAPSKYAPSTNPELSVARARQVLKQMYEEGYISKDVLMHSAPPTIIERGSGRGAIKNPYFTDYVLAELGEYIENTNQPLNIFTTLDLNAQQALEKVAESFSSELLSKYNSEQMAAVLMQENGAIKAMLGGLSYKRSQFNRAVNAKRQAGSSFKFFVYSAAMEHGILPSDVYVDKPISLYQGKGLDYWTPRNFNRKFAGNMTVEDAFANSINTVAVQISEEVGRKNVIKMAHRLGVESKVPDLPSIALGTSQISLLELTQAYAHIASDGLMVHAFGITKITDQHGNVLFEKSAQNREQLLNEDVVSKMKQLLNAVVDHGNGKNASMFLRNVYGKTGTTQNHQDAYFIGFTGDMVMGVWSGNDDNTATNRLVGGTLPAKIFKSFFDSVGDIQTTTLESNSPSYWSNYNIFDAVFGTEPGESEENLD